MIVDNGGISGAQTVIPAVPQGLVLSTGQKTLTDFGNFTPVGAYVGLYVNPNVAQGSVTTLTDDQIYVVASHDQDTLTVSDGEVLPNAVTSVGKTYRGIFVVNYLEVRGGAHLTTTGDLLVKQGDLHSTGATFDVPSQASITANTLDVPTAEKGKINGTITTPTLMCKTCP